MFGTTQTTQSGSGPISLSTTNNDYAGTNETKIVGVETGLVVLPRADGLSVYVRAWAQRCLNSLITITIRKFYRGR